MQLRRLSALMGLVFSLVLSLTIPAPAQKPSKQAKGGKLTSSKPAGKDKVIRQTLSSVAPHVTNCPTKVPITPGQTINGILSNSDCSLSDGSFFDEYTFSATAGQQLFVTMSSAAFDTYLILLDPANNDTQDDDGGGGTNSRIPTTSGFYTAPSTGTYAILANSFDPATTGNYSVTLTFGSGGTGCPPTPTPISNGQTINGTFVDGDCALADSSRYDLYSFTASAGQQVSITMTGTSPVDPYLILVAPDTDTIGEDDNGGGGTTARIPPVAGTFGTLPATGTYIIYANTALGNQFGNYSITLNFSGSTCASTPIALGQTINGTLATGDCRLPFDGSFFDSYTFSGTAGQSIAIAQTSSAFDSFLILLSPSGSGLAADDDSGGGSNARIPGPSGGFTLPTTGTYTILANSFDPLGTGNYGLTLSLAGGPTTAQLLFSTFAAGEGFGAVSINLTRTGDLTLPASVNYATSDTAGLNNCSFINGVASARCDYITSVGTVRFAIGEGFKTLNIPLVDDAYAEGDESFTFTISNPVGTTLGLPTTATITINDNEATNGPNPLDGTAFFVRQQYLDFLGREPDPSGAAWQALINGCAPGDISCDRIHVSSAFFRSPEFQDRGYFVYRFYSTAFGRKPAYAEFIPDLAKVSGFLSPAELEAAKVAFVNEFMLRNEFTTKYPTSLTNTQYVDLLLTTAGVTHPGRDFWIAALGNGTLTRAQVLRMISESQQVYDKYYNEAFVVMQYFGYLRRDPDALFINWISGIEGVCGVGHPCANPDDYRGMINGFMNSLEYRARFGAN
jgi:hypothetical protein